MSKKSTTTTNSSSNTSQSTKIDPVVMNLALGNYGRAEGIADGLVGYTGERVAGFNNDQRAGQAALRNIANTATPNYDLATGTVKDLMGFRPQQVSASGYQPASASAAHLSRGDVRNVSAGQVRDADLSAYMNPYEDDVVNAGLGDLERARQMQRVNDSQRAQSAGAWGGDRHGVVDSLTNEASLRQAGGLAAQLRLAGHDRATGLAGADIDRRFAADQANQGYDFNIADRNAGYAQQANLANADAINQAGAFAASQRLSADQGNQNADLAGADLRQGAAGLLAGLTQQQIQDQIGRAQLLAGIGADQQANAQAGLDATYDEFVRAQDARVTGQQMLNSALGGVPVPMTVTGTSNSRDVTRTRDTGQAIGNALQIASMFAASDGRLKTDIETSHYDGRGRRWVDFRYAWDEPDVRRTGVIAQEVAETDPQAVAVGPSGILFVDYSKLET